MAVDDFFQNCMQLEYNITYEMVHRLGKMKKDSNCPVVMHLTDPKDVHAILVNTGKLKDIHNSKGTPYFIAVQLPESLQEERHSYQCMMQRNKEKAPADQLSLKLQGHTLYVNGKLYKRVVVPPTVADVLSMPRQDKEQISAISFTKGPWKEDKNNQFIPYAIKVGEHTQIKEAYMAL